MTLGPLVAAARTLAPEAREAVDPADRSAATVTGVTHDSRAVAPGMVFVAIRGQRTDGALFAEEAVRRGALAIVAETAAVTGVTVPWLRTSDARLALAELSHLFYGRPGEELVLIGVTGTNGKTTTTYLLASVLAAAGLPCGRLGTVTCRVGPSASDEREASRTTPESSDVQRLLRDMVNRGCKACAIEVSSHALALHRVAYLSFSAAIFTNLSREHLDFHGDMQRYFAAKRRLFEMLPADAPAAINIDDPRGAELAGSRSRVVTFGIDRPADVRATAIRSSFDGLQFDVDTPGGRFAVRSPLVGRPNVYNILGVVATAIGLDLPTAAIERGIPALESVPGRFQIVSGDADDVRVVVDYAHTDDALKNTLETARSLALSRVITVFGCGGDRDRTKRPLMGAVAARLSDLVVLTSDNPRSEDPDHIIEEITRGLATTPEPVGLVRESTPFVANADRREAIGHAIEVARPGDIVVIAGKGHERRQVVAERTLPFDDVEAARAALGQRRAASRV